MVRTQSLSRELVLLGVLVALIVAMAIASSLFLTDRQPAQHLALLRRAGADRARHDAGDRDRRDRPVGGRVARARVRRHRASPSATGVPLWLALILGAADRAAVRRLQRPLHHAARPQPARRHARDLRALPRARVRDLRRRRGVAASRAGSRSSASTTSGPVPLQLFVFIVAAVAVGVLLARGRFGRYVRAIGYNPRAARFSGVPVGRTIARRLRAHRPARRGRRDHLHLARLLRAGRLRARARARRDRRRRARRREHPRRLGHDRRHRARRADHRRAAQRAVHGRRADHVAADRHRRRPDRRRLRQRVLPRGEA